MSNILKKRIIGKKHKIVSEMYGDIEHSYPHDWKKFVEAIIWWEGEERDECIARKNEDFLLLMIMGKHPGFVFDHAKACFGFTDDDFRRALKNAEPGIILYENDWLAWNEELNVNPPYFPPSKNGLPFFDKNEYFSPLELRKVT